MKLIALILLVCSTSIGMQAKFICSQDVMGDSTFTSVFKTGEECRKYCVGIGKICEETGDHTDVNVNSVD
ncbi:hypothetical protein H0X06_04495 [Candidatus Dependentiae bacterium]|nr:hypothetical protein [Candidatus Dependentiae bacterium]